MREIWQRNAPEPNNRQTSKCIWGHRYLHENKRPKWRKPNSFRRISEDNSCNDIKRESVTILVGVQPLMERYPCMYEERESIAFRLFDKIFSGLPALAAKRPPTILIGCSYCLPVLLGYHYTNELKNSLVL